jgi:hypothetical protein
MKALFFFIFIFSALYSASVRDSSWYATIGANSNSKSQNYSSRVMNIGAEHRWQLNYIGYEMGFSLDNQIEAHGSYLSALNLDTKFLFYPFPSLRRWNPYLGIGGQETIYRNRIKLHIADLIRFKTPRENRSIKGSVGMQFPISRSFLEFSYLECLYPISNNRIELRYGKSF